MKPSGRPSPGGFAMLSMGKPHRYHPAPSMGRKRSPEELQQFCERARSHGATVSGRGCVLTFTLDAHSSNDPQMLSKGERTRREREKARLS